MHGGAEVGEARGADVDGFEGAAGEGCGFEADGGVVLAAVGVAFYGGVEDGEAALGRVEDLAGEEDGAGAGAEGGLGADEVLEEVVEAGAFEVLEEGGGFAAGEDEAVDEPFVFRVDEFGGVADEGGAGAEFGEAGGVDLEGALEGEDADAGWGFGHRMMIGQGPVIRERVDLFWEIGEGGSRPTILRSGQDFIGPDGG